MPSSRVIASLWLVILIGCWSSATLANQPDIAQELEAINALPAGERQQALQRLQQLLPALDDSVPVTLRQNVLSALMSKQNASGDKAAALATAEQLIALGIEHKHDVARAEGMSFKANLLNDAGQHSEALLLAKESIDYAMRSGQLRALQNSHNTVGVIYNDRGDFSNALQHYLKALSYGEEAAPGNELRSMLLQTNISILYDSLKDPHKALAYADQAYALAEKLGRRRNMATLSINRGGLLKDLQQPAEALAAMQQGLQIATEIGDEKVQAIALNNLADYHLSQQQYNQAATLARQAIALGEKLNDSNRQAVGLANLGLALGGKGQIKQGVAQIERAMALYEQADAPAKQEVLYGELSQLYERAGLYQQAVQALRQQQQLSQQLFTAERDRAVTELQQQFDAQERRKQIDLLMQKNALQASELRNNELQQQLIILAAVLILLVAAFVWTLYRRAREANQLLRYHAIRDPLTGLFNRRYFQETMTKRRAHGQRRRGSAESPDALVLIDVDFFKRINDSFGHAAGDEVLSEMARRLAKIMRDTDTVFRWGGEEFLVLLRNIPPSGLDALVGRLLQQLAQPPVQWQQQSIPVTVSAGYLSLPLAGLNESQLGWEKALNLADMALYLSKHRGRNRAHGVLRLNALYEDIAPHLPHDFAGVVDNGMVSVQEILGTAPLATAVAS